MNCQGAACFFYRKLSFENKVHFLNDCSSVHRDVKRSIVDSFYLGVEFVSVLQAGNEIDRWGMDKKIVVFERYLHRLMVYMEFFDIYLFEIFRDKIDQKEILLDFFEIKGLFSLFFDG